MPQTPPPTPPTTPRLSGIEAPFSPPALTLAKTTPIADAKVVNNPAAVSNNRLATPGEEKATPQESKQQYLLKTLEQSLREDVRRAKINVSITDEITSLLGKYPYLRYAAQLQAIAPTLPTQAQQNQLDLVQANSLLHHLLEHRAEYVNYDYHKLETLIKASNTRNEALYRIDRHWRPLMRACLDASPERKAAESSPGVSYAPTYAAQEPQRGSVARFRR